MAGKRQSRRSNFFFVALIILIIILSAFNIFNYIRNKSSILEEKEVYAKIIVSDKYGFDVNGTALTFGMTPPGESQSIKSTIQNRFDFPVKVQISSKGKISPMLLVSDNNFILQVNEIKNLKFTAFVRPETSEGFYDGYVSIITRKA